MRVVDAMRLHQRIGELDDLRKIDSRGRLKRAQPVPNRERRIHRRVGVELPNRVEINRSRRWQHIFDDRVDVGIEPIRTRDRLGGTLRIDRHRLADLRERRRNFVLPQQEIAVTPRHFRRNRIHALRLLKRIARRGGIAFRFVSAREIEPRRRRMRIERQRVAIRRDGALRVGLLDVVLPIAPEQKPRLGIARLELHGALLPLARFHAGKMRGNRVATARISESGGEDCGDEKKCGARDRAGEAQNHSTVLCLTPARGCNRNLRNRN